MNRVYETILTRRSIRRYKQKPIRLGILKKLVNAARLAPSAANLQPCEYIIIKDKKVCRKIFKALRWAAYIAPKGTPAKGERPTAYIVVILNKNRSGKWGKEDASAGIENIILTAAEIGIGSCWLGAIDRPKIKAMLKIPDFCSVEYVVALGYPDEHPASEPLKGSVKYWLDKTGKLHVPKRPLSQILHYNRY